MNNNEGRLPYLTTLTPLRGIAAIFVVLHHSDLFFGSFLPASLTHFFQNSWIWVDFFFILSGFILSYSYGSFFKKVITWTTYKKYLAARLARIYPLYLATWIWAFLVVRVIVSLAKGIDDSIADILNVKAFLPGVFFLQDLHLYKKSPLNFPAWSIAAEWWIYMLFPFLMPFFSTANRAKMIFIFVAIVVSYGVMKFFLAPQMLVASYDTPTINMTADFDLFRCMAGFCTGMLLHVVYQKRIAYPLFRQNWCFCLFASATIWAIHATVMDILIVGLFPFVLLCAAYNTTGIKKILDMKILQRLGDWSFSIYMVHGPIILMFFSYSVYKNSTVFSTVTSSPSGGEINYAVSVKFCVVLLVLTLLVASITYRFIELPARKYLKKRFATFHSTTVVSKR